MKKLKILILIALSGPFLFVSCDKDDGGDDYVALNITTQPDAAQVFQNESVDIAVLNNDTNVPADGILTVSGGNGTIEVSNKTVRYSAGDSFMGDDVFQYTICDGNGENCKTESVTVSVLPVSQVDLDLDRAPYDTLSEYKFFDGAIADQVPAYSVLPYEPISPLFSDYAKKKRFVWMPTGEQAKFVSDGEILDFPIGTALIKNFYYENVQPGNVTRIIETRVMIKKQEGWIFAEYIWNDAQTEATLDASGNGAFTEIEWIQEDGKTRNLNYRIPSTSECGICHKLDAQNVPLGTEAQNLNGNYNYTDGVANQLQKMIDVGYLEDSVPANIETLVDWTNASEPLELRVRSYLDTNCASCHIDGGHAGYRSIRLDYPTSGDTGEIGVCKDPDTPVVGLEDDKLVTPGDPENSILYFRMNTTFEQYRMPIVGRQLQHEQGVALVAEWINSLTDVCE